MTTDALLRFLIIIVLCLCIAPKNADQIQDDHLHSAENLLHHKKFPVVYYFTIQANACKKGLPNYLLDTINQAVETQIDCCQVYLISTFKLCKAEHSIDLDVGYDSRMIRIDFDDLKSIKTMTFLNNTDQLFAADGLWTASANRFFALEDLMRKFNFNSILHVEGDNLLFGPLGIHAIPDLISGYKNLAATILAPKIVTASVLWVGNLESLADFNSWMITLARNSSDSLRGYVDWLWQSACCYPPERGGLFCDSFGHSGCLRPYAVNEMSILGYFHAVNGSILQFLPLFPVGSFVLNRKHMNVSEYSPGGNLVGPGTGNGVWDSGSYGQYIGGTPRFRGNNKGFIDFFHVIGQGILRAGCKPKFMCGNNFTSAIDCRMGPFVRCNDGPWTPLWNLHVHCKLTTQFRNVACPCRNESGMPYSPSDEAVELERMKKEDEESAKKTPSPLPPFKALQPLAEIVQSDYIPIVYFYIISKSECEIGLPSYLKDTVGQAVNTQSSSVFLISSFNRCKKNGGFDIGKGFTDRVNLVDFEDIQSEETKSFIEVSVNILGSDGLWASSAIRFFSLNDLMTKMMWERMIHIEGDNFLYEDLSLDALAAISKNYKALAATQLSGSFVTASVFWVGKRASLFAFNSWLLSISNETSSEFLTFLNWLRPKACCLSEAKGGLYPDKDGNGIRPFAMNEMTMLMYYHEANKKELELLPLLPGDMVGAYAGNGVFDPGSYGQYLGGTPRFQGKNKKFIDFLHILGQGMIKSACFPHFLCGPALVRQMKIARKLIGVDVSMLDINELLQRIDENNNVTSVLKCQTSPYVRCGVHDDAYNVTYGPWKRIFNLHVHSKHTEGFKTTACECRSVMPYIMS